jgi:hypothetical protein
MINKILNPNKNHHKLQRLFNNLKNNNMKLKWQEALMNLFKIKNLIKII